MVADEYLRLVLDSREKLMPVHHEPETAIEAAERIASIDFNKNLMKISHKHKKAKASRLGSRRGPEVESQ